MSRFADPDAVRIPPVSQTVKIRIARHISICVHKESFRKEFKRISPFLGAVVAAHRPVEICFVRQKIVSIYLRVYLVRTKLGRDSLSSPLSPEEVGVLKCIRNVLNLIDPLKPTPPFQDLPDYRVVVSSSIGVELEVQLSVHVSWKVLGGDCRLLLQGKVIRRN